jgi:hypothetical protein
MKKECKKTQGSAYAENFAFLLMCKNCNTVCGELGGNAYTAEHNLNAVIAEKKKCPVCGATDWVKVRRIENFLTGNK